MKYNQWLEILSAINTDNNLNEGNVIEKIKDKLKEENPDTHQEWKNKGFDIDYMFNDELTLLYIATGNCPKKYAKYKNWWTLLHLAARNDYAHVVNSLISRGATVNVADENGITPLHLAAAKNNIKMVRALIEHNAKVDAVDKNGWTPLHLAAAKNNIKMVRALIEHNAKVDAVDKNGWTTLHLAAEKGCADIVNFLIRKEADINAQDEADWTPLHLAVQNNHIETVRALVRDKEDKVVNAVDKEGFTPLHLAAQHGCIDIIKVLIEHDAKVDVSNKNGLTSLHLAAAFKHKGAVELLIDKGAKINMLSTRQETPLYLAIQYGCAETVEILKEALRKKGADINAVIDDNGRNLLHVASQNGHIKMVDFLINNGENVNAVDGYGTTPLLLAIKNNRIEIAKVLIAAGADINAENKEGVTPLYWANKNGYTGVVEALTAKGIDVDAANENGYTLLYLAAQNGYTDITSALIKKGVNVDKADEYGTTPLLLAIANNHTKIAETLIVAGANVNAVNGDGCTPLLLAIANNRMEIAGALIAAGGNVNAVDKNGCTPLQCAIHNGHEKIVKALLEKGADPLAGKTSFRLLKYLVKLIKNDDSKYPKQAEEPQQEEEPEDNEYEFLKYSLLLRNNCSLIDAVEVGTFDSLVCTWFADTFGLTPSQKELNEKLLNIIKDIPYCSANESFTRLKKFSLENKKNDDLETILNLARGESKSTVLHVLSNMRNPRVENCIDLLLDAGAKLDIEDDRGRIPLDVAIDNRNYYVEGLLLANEQIILGDELSYALKDLNKLQEFLNKHKHNLDLKRVLNLRNSEGELLVLRYARDCHDETSYEKAKNLLVEAGANDCKKSDKKERLPRPGALWNDLISNQQEKLKTSLGEVDKAQNMDELARVVNKAIESGVRINFPKQEKLYGKAYENQYGFTDFVIKKISELKKKHKTERDIEVASGIVCKLVSQGAMLHNINSMCVIDELEEFKDHKANMKQACLDHQRCTLKFIEIVKSAASGRVKDVRMDASTFYLRYSKDSTVKPAEITDGARNLGLIHGETKYGRNIIKIGKSEVEIITENGIRNYTNLADGSNIILTFYTTQGELDVRLYPDKQNKDLIRVEVQDQEKFKKLKSCNEEIGKNCRLGGLSVNQAIGQGFFGRSGKLMRSEAISPYNGQTKVGLWTEREEIKRVSNSKTQFRLTKF